MIYSIWIVKLISNQICTFYIMGKYTVSCTFAFLSKTQKYLSASRNKEILTSSFVINYHPSVIKLSICGSGQRHWVDRYRLKLEKMLSLHVCFSSSRIFFFFHVLEQTTNKFLSRIGLISFLFSLWNYLAADWRSYFIIFNKRYQKSYDTSLIRLFQRFTGLLWCKNTSFS